jgi:hypothetical protein
MQSPANAFLPWSDEPMRLYRGAAGYLRESLPPPLRNFLPAKIDCYADDAVPEGDVDDFIFALPEFFSAELRRRLHRAETAAGATGLDVRRIVHFLTARRDRQPWALIWSKHGGLPLPGVVPCSSMRNHGVAWRRNANGSVCTWLATAPKESLPWNFDSDIGHESAHAAFAHVPLFAQDIQNAADDAWFNDLVNAAAMSPGHAAKLCYLLVELAVVIVRGERRETESGLPMVDASELLAMLAVADELMPRCGFAEALRSALRRGGRFDVANDPEVFRLLVPLLPAVERISTITSEVKPPSAQWFRATGELNVRGRLRPLP